MALPEFDRECGAMIFRLLAMTLTTVLAPASASAQGIDWSGRYWICSYRAGLGEGRTALSGEFTKTFNLEGTRSLSGYYAWGGVWLRWEMTQTGRQLTYLAAEMRSAREPSGVYGYLYGDDVLVSKSTLLDPAGYRSGYASGFLVSLYDKDVAELDRHDRWTLVTRTGDGAEIERRVLPVPGRRKRDHAFAGYQAVIAAAWKARDEKFLETAGAATLPPAPAHCLFSTPETRAEIEEMSKIEDPLRIGPRPRP